MLSIPADRDFAGFVTRCREGGMSSASIASALNHSVWANPDGRAWNFRQVSKLCWSADDETCTRADCDFHRLQAVLRSILTWSPFDPEQARLITMKHSKGASAGSIAADLNVAHLSPPAGRKWTAGLVRALVQLYACECEVSIDPNSSDQALVSAAA